MLPTTAAVAATASMVALATPISQRLRFLPSSLGLAAAATLAAQVGVTPLLLFYFHEVPVSTVAANVLAFPAVAPALLLGLAALRGELWPPPAPLRVLLPMGLLGQGLYSATLYTCLSLTAATENSMGFVGTSVGAAPTSNALRPWLKTSFTTPFAATRGR